MPIPGYLCDQTPAAEKLWELTQNSSITLQLIVLIKFISFFNRWTHGFFDSKAIISMYVITHQHNADLLTTDNNLKSKLVKIERS